MSNFPEVIKRLRIEKGLTQKETASLLNVSQPVIYYWETGKREPNMAMLQKLATFYNVNIDVFFNSAWDDFKLTNDATENVFGASEESFTEYARKLPSINTIAAHHEDEEWTDEELAEIEEFKKFVLSKRKKD